MNRSIPRGLALVLSALVVFAAISVVSPANAQGQQVRVSLSVSNNQVNAQGVIYTAQLSTASEGVVTEITATVPPLTSGAVVVGAVFGIGAGSVRLAGNTLTYRVYSPVAIAAGTSLAIEFSGLTNGPNAASFFSSLTTRSSSGVLDAASSAEVLFGNPTTAVSIMVPRSLTFTCSCSGGTSPVAPHTSESASSAIQMTVATNTTNGYSLFAARAEHAHEPSHATAPALVLSSMLSAASVNFSATLLSPSGRAYLTSSQGFSVPTTPAQFGSAPFVMSTGATGILPDSITIDRLIGAADAAAVTSGSFVFTAVPSY